MRRAPSIQLHWEQRRLLTGLAVEASTPTRVALRARIALRAADGAQNTTIARELGTSAATAALWRRRFLAHGVAGLTRDAPRSGRPPSISWSRIEAVRRAGSERAAPDGPRRSGRSLAREFGMSRSTVQRILHAQAVRRRRGSRVPGSDRGLGFLDSVTDLVGLYLNPPARALALSTDERVGVGASQHGREATRPNPPRRSPGAEFRAFLQVTERETPRVLEVHLLVDGRLSPVPPEVDQWLSRHPRFHLHVLPSSPVGLTLMDRLIDGFSVRKDRPGASASAHRLKNALREHLRGNRDSSLPFVWTATSGEIRGAYGRRDIP